MVIIVNIVFLHFYSDALPPPFFGQMTAHTPPHSKINRHNHIVDTLSQPQPIRKLCHETETTMSLPCLSVQLEINFQSSEPHVYQGFPQLNNTHNLCVDTHTTLDPTGRQLSGHHVYKGIPL